MPYFTVLYSKSLLPLTCYKTQTPHPVTKIAVPPRSTLHGKPSLGGRNWIDEGRTETTLICWVLPICSFCACVPLPSEFIGPIEFPFLPYHSQLIACLAKQQPLPSAAHRGGFCQNLIDWLFGLMERLACSTI